MSEPEEILQAAASFFSKSLPLNGYKALVTSGPTYEPLDPVRFIGNRSSGKQGHAIAQALAKAGADVTLVTGPVSIDDPKGVTTIHVETAVEMHDACRKALPADIAVCAAAVSDWSATTIQSQKIKKQGDKTPPNIQLKENPDILAALSQNPAKRPTLVIGFAAETENLIESATSKRRNKGCDWIVANDVSNDENGQNVFGSDQNHVYLINGSGTEEWQQAGKIEIAEKLVNRITEHFKSGSSAIKDIAAE